MPTIVHRLDRDVTGKEMLLDMRQGMYLHGECYAFATAIHQGLGWPMVGLIHNEVIHHAAVRSPDGRLCDARGFVSEEAFGSPFGFTPPYDLREIAPENLHRPGESRETRENSIRMARAMAEVLWPELPWKNSLVSRIIVFADELEALSRKHGFWIKSPVPTATSVIVLGKNDEGGYMLYPTADGFTYTYTIDRYLSS